MLNYPRTKFDVKSGLNPTLSVAVLSVHKCCAFVWFFSHFVTDQRQPRPVLIKCISSIHSQLIYVKNFLVRLLCMLKTLTSTNKLVY